MPNPHLMRELAQLGVLVIFLAVNDGGDGSELSQCLVKQFHEVHVRSKASADDLFIPQSATPFSNT